MGSRKDPGRFGTIKFPVTASTILTLVLIIAAWVYASHPAWHSDMDFLGIGFTMIATVLSAYYIGLGFRVTAEQRAEGLRNDRISRAFRYVDAWDDPWLSRTKQTVRHLVQTAKASANPDQALNAALDADKEALSAVWDILNFFEGFCLAINQNIADEETLRRAFKSMVIEDFLTLQSLINRTRTTTQRPHLFAELETVAKGWNT